MDAPALRQYNRCLGNLLLAHAEGWHVFVPDRAVTDHLIASNVLSPWESGFLQQTIRPRVADLMGQARSASRVIYCIPDDEPSLTIDERQLCVPLSRFENLEACSASELLTENAQRDGSFYFHVAESLMATTAKLPLSLRLLHGGGDTVAGELVRDAGSCPPRICVVDTDRSFPRGPLGQTAKRVLQKFESSDDPLIAVALTHGRTIENYVAPDIAAALVGTPEMEERAAALALIDADERAAGVIAEERTSLFISFKKGVKFGDIRKCPAPHRISLVQYVACLGGETACAPLNDPSNDNLKVVQPTGAALIEKIVHLKDENAGAHKELCANILAAHPSGKLLTELLGVIVAFGLGTSRSVSRARV